ncbi:MAG: class I SAM-dependent methyltransferase [Halodesulfurarchaeum sp.]
MGSIRGGRLDPVPGTPADTRAWYDLASRLYALLVEDLEFPPTRRAIDLLDSQNDDRVLDVGCGAGRGVVEIAQELAVDGQVLGVDFAPGMCRETRRAISQAGVGDRAGIVCGDGTVLPVPDSTVDGIISSFVLDLLSPADIEAAVTEMARVVRPDGRIAVVSLNESDALTTRLYRGLRTLFPTQLDCRPIPVDAFLEAGGLSVVHDQRYSLHGLPVSVVVARP